MANLPMGGCVTQVSIMREVKNLLGFIWAQRILNRARNGRVMADLPTGSWVTPGCIMGDWRDWLGLHLNQKTKNRQRNGWVMANLPIVGCMTPLSIMQDVWDSLALYLNQKVLKSEKKLPSCGQFITGGWVIPVIYAGCMGSIRASFEPKKI